MPLTFVLVLSPSCFSQLLAVILFLYYLCVSSSSCSKRHAFPRRCAAVLFVVLFLRRRQSDRPACVCLLAAFRLFICSCWCHVAGDDRRQVEVWELLEPWPAQDVWQRENLRLLWERRHSTSARGSKKSNGRKFAGTSHTPTAAADAAADGVPSESEKSRAMRTPTLGAQSMSFGDGGVTSPTNNRGASSSPRRQRDQLRAESQQFFADGVADVYDAVDDVPPDSRDCVRTNESTPCACACACACVHVCVCVCVSGSSWWSCNLTPSACSCRRQHSDECAVQHPHARFTPHAVACCACKRATKALSAVVERTARWKHCGIVYRLCDAPSSGCAKRCSTPGTSPCGRCQLHHAQQQAPCKPCPCPQPLLVRAVVR